MSLTNNGWKNKNGTAGRACKCGSWKQHWIKGTGKVWPSECSVSGCTEKPTVGAHIINEAETGEWIAPLCDACNKRTESFDLDGGVTLVPANKQNTCEA